MNVEIGTETAQHNFFSGNTFRNSAEADKLALKCRINHGTHKMMCKALTLSMFFFNSISVCAVNFPMSLIVFSQCCKVREENKNSLPYLIFLLQLYLCNYSLCHTNNLQ
jgi:hypothetical protein